MEKLLFSIVNVHVKWFYKFAIDFDYKCLMFNFQQFNFKISVFQSFNQSFTLFFHSDTIISLSYTTRYHQHLAIQNLFSIDPKAFQIWCLDNDY